MDDQVKPPALPHQVEVTPQWRAEQAAKRRAYDVQRRRWMARLEAPEIHAGGIMPATPADPMHSTPAPASPRRKKRQAPRMVDVRQSAFQFYEE